MYMPGRLCQRVNYGKKYRFLAVFTSFLGRGRPSVRGFGFAYFWMLLSSWAFGLVWMGGGRFDGVLACVEAGTNGAIFSCKIVIYCHNCVARSVHEVCHCFPLVIADFDDQLGDFLFCQPRMRA